jgi:hypothetical protein
MPNGVDKINPICYNKDTIKKGIDTMKIEILVIDENAIVIKGLRSAAESRSIANAVDGERRASIMGSLRTQKFLESVIEDMTQCINRASEDGRREIIVTGYGDRSSPLRAYGEDRCDIMEEIIKYQVFPIFTKQGYKCKVSRYSFASAEKYFEIKIVW